MEPPETSDKWNNIAPLAFNKIYNMAITGKHYIVPIKIEANEILDNIRKAKSHIKSLQISTSSSNLTKDMKIMANYGQNRLNVVLNLFDK